MYVWSWISRSLFYPSVSAPCFCILVLGNEGRPQWEDPKLKAGLGSTERLSQEEKAKMNRIRWLATVPGRPRALNTALQGVTVGFHAARRVQSCFL